MPRMIMYRKSNPKKLARIAFKRERKLRIKEAIRCAEMKDAFAQLTPIDDYKIRKRVAFEINPKRTYLHTTIQRLNLAYKYTCELLETVAI